MNCQQKAIAHGKNPPRFDETTRSQTKTSGLSFLTSSVFNLTLPRKSHGARKILVDFCLVRSLSVTIGRVQENIDARQSEIAFSYDEAHAHKKQYETNKTIPQILCSLCVQCVPLRRTSSETFCLWRREKIINERITKRQSPSHVIKIDDIQWLSHFCQGTRTETTTKTKGRKNNTRKTTAQRNWTDEEASYERSRETQREEEARKIGKNQEKTKQRQ